MIYLIHYDREKGELQSIAEYADKERDAASHAKMELEISLLAMTGRSEVVLLEASSEERLRETHGRYFESLEELRAKRRRRASRESEEDEN